MSNATEDAIRRMILAEEGLKKTGQELQSILNEAKASDIPKLIEELDPPKDLKKKERRDWKKTITKLAKKIKKVLGG